ncbi:nucleoside triphosphate pyrophosphohydrolase [Paenibacillus motobuensis]|uniref:nucleoside triphosphate pyrophosphohydrolase n=1 Tax=Paenibacillus TaxID=44249 RepID=UPI00203D0114|nr:MULTISPECIES: nucleoside triphosphate pyrophosphohydrolase [Paenibacillus]MCM3040643.1 nucleoside triphosphate pyrophosphohydrolase [Paenibacillus lutimineralis]MCM3647747.1 nucleoside triphosphate pyrophosphohydrolase [Paenibacillus motobuensis]
MPTYNKLVRDFIPDIIGAQGKQYSIKTLDMETYSIELRKKLQEEHQEYISAKTDQEAAEELADMLEVIYALATIHGVTEQEMNQLRSEKAQKRGGFKERIMLIEAEA